MKIKSKLMSYQPHLGLFFVFSSILHGETEGQSQYGSYADYSTIPHGDSNSIPILQTSGDLSKNADLTSTRVSDEISEQSKIRLRQTSGKTPQDKAGSQSVFYYEMFPSLSKQQQPQQTCTYVGNVMKCQYKRESTTNGGGYSTNSFGNNANPGDSYSVSGSSYKAPSSSYGDTSYSSSYDTPTNNYGPPSNTGSGYGYSSDMMNMENSNGGGGIGGLGGLAGLLGLKGLKALIPFAFLLPLVPLLIPLVLFLILLPILPLILLLPIPVIVTDQAGRKLGENQVNFRTVNLSAIIGIASDVLESEECVQKLSCEIGRMSRKYNMSNWTDRFAEALPNNRYTKKIRQGYMKNSILAEEDLIKIENLKQPDGNCSTFTCKPNDIAAKHLVQ